MTTTAISPNPYIQTGPHKNNVCLQVSNLCKSYRNDEEKRDKKVLHDISFQVRAGQVVSILGPSGSGKSTLLQCILGTLKTTSGVVLADGKVVNKPSDKVGIVYQDYALYPFMTARENAAFGLKLRETNIPYRMLLPFGWWKLRKNHLQQADEMLKKVGLFDARNSYPRELSGGMRQRVAVAQALIMKPSILLMDEPFGALDEATRESLQLMILNLYQENIKAKKAGNRPPYTILIVTHELNEALYVADRVIGLTQFHPEGDKGATVVYDMPAPVFRPGDAKDVEIFAAQKEEIRRMVFSPENVKNSEKLIKLWHSSDEFLPGEINHKVGYSEDRI